MTKNHVSASSTIAFMIFMIAGATLCNAQGTPSQNNPLLKTLLQQHPDADLNRDGVLTETEARDYLQKAQEQTSSSPKPPAKIPPPQAILTKPAGNLNGQISNLMSQMGLNPNATLKDCVVLLTARVQTLPPRITLNWKEVPGNNGYIISRRDKDGAIWKVIATLPAGEVSYTDATVSSGKEYEYKAATTIPGIPPSQIAAMLPQLADKLAQGKAVGYEIPELEFGKVYGYVLSGIEVALKDSRGKVILLVEANAAEKLAPEIARLTGDLEGDGWFVIRHDITPVETPGEIRGLVQTDYKNDPASVKSVFILGHIPIPYSGDYTPDGHFQRVGAQPADIFYASMDGLWTDATVNTTEEEKKRPAGMQSTLPEDANTPGDGRFDQSDIPGKIWLQVGRVDFSNMPAFAPLTEIDLLRRYLDKDHAFRHKMYTVKEGCLVEDDLNTTAALGYSFSMAAAHTCTPMFGADNVTLVKGNWLKTLCETGSQWAFAFAGSEFDHCGGIVATRQLVDTNPKVVFIAMFGSYFGYWPAKNDVMRAMIASKTYTLGCVYASSPPINLHAMSLGETAGYGVWYSQHPDVCPGACAGRVHTEWMGDPTLRMHIVAPAQKLSVKMISGVAHLQWKASEDDVLGYHVYRAATAAGPFTRLTGVSVTENTFTDSGHVPGNSTYMVRAVKLETSASGSYYNASQGIFAMDATTAH